MIAQLGTATFTLAALFLARQVAIPPAQAPLTENRAPVPVVPPPAMAEPSSAQIDRWFAAAARASDNAELAMAELALRRSRTDEVRAYARTMISEHTGLSRALEPLLRRVAGPPRSPALAPSDALTYYRLEHAPDVDFDQTYALAQVGGHLAALGAFQTEREHGADASLKRVVTTWTPTIQAHLELAIDVTRHIGGDSPLKTGAQ